MGDERQHLLCREMYFCMLAAPPDPSLLMMASKPKESPTAPSWRGATTSEERRRLVQKLRQEHHSVSSRIAACALVAALCVLLLLLIAIPLFPLLLMMLPQFVAWSLVLSFSVLLAFVWRRRRNRCRAEIYQNPVAALDEYKRVLVGLLPPEFLTPDGLIKRPDGTPEPICIVTAKGLSAVGFKEKPESADYAAIDVRAGFLGGLPYKALRHRLEKVRDALPVEEYGILRKFVARNLELLGSENEIDLRSGRDKGTLAHETFHDIQGFLYDHHPEIIDALQQACFARQDMIATWHKDPESAAWTQSGYKLHHIFPETVDDVPYRTGMLLEDAVLFLDDALQHRDISPVTWEAVLTESHKDLGRLEAIPLLISAGICGNEGAKAILREVLVDAGLRSTLFSNAPNSSLHPSPLRIRQ